MATRRVGEPRRHKRPALLQLQSLIREQGEIDEVALALVSLVWWVGVQVPAPHPVT
jgi:hypothetical protein